MEDKNTVYMSEKQKVKEITDKLEAGLKELFTHVNGIFIFHNSIVLSFFHEKRQPSLIVFFDMPIQFASFLDCFFITLLSFLYPSLKYCSLIFGVHCDLADTIHILKQINCCPYRKLHILQAVHLCYDSG